MPIRSTPAPRALVVYAVTLMTACADAGEPTTSGTSLDDATTAATPTTSTSGPPPDTTSAGTGTDSATSLPTDSTDSTDPTDTPTTAAPTCDDAAVNGDETDLDCGGSCPACPDGAACLVDADCASASCVDGTCTAPVCVTDADCAALDGPCAAGACDRGACVAVPLPDGTACDDLQFCTTGPAACTGGACVDPDGFTGHLALAEVGLGVPGFTLESAANVGHARVALIPDFNGDGLADIVVGTSTWMNYRGRVYLVYGKPDTTPVNLDTLHLPDNAHLGLVIEGGANNQLGSEVAGGDIDGDGRGDLLITSDIGDTYVAFGRDNPSSITQAQLTAGNQGFVIQSDYDDKFLGGRLAADGDVDGDGRDDILVGDDIFDLPQGTQAGRGFLVYGKAGGAPIHLIEDVADGPAGFTIDGAGANDRSAHELDFLGDVNGDGLDDIVNSRAQEPPGGGAHVVFGGALADVEVADIDAGVGGYPVLFEGEGFALEVFGVGDVDGDGLGDMLFGDPYHGDGDEGRAWIVFGKADTAPVDLADVAAGVGGFMVDGAGSSRLGAGLGPAGDLDQDGLADFMVTATYARKVFIVYGKQDTDPVTVADLLTGQGGFVLDGEGDDNDSGPGYVLDGRHDVNGDGRTDLLIGPANFAQPDSSRTYIIFGGDCHP